MSGLLRASRLAKWYTRGPETIHALRGVDLEIGPGEFVAIAGPSGSGKTTLLNVIIGWEQPDEGWVEFRGRSPEGAAWKDLAIVPQRLGLAEELTLLENIALPGRLDGGDVHSRPGGLLERLSIDSVADRVPSEVSLGEQQRAALARALVLNPALVVADEPTGHQDEESTVAMLVEIARVCDSRSSCLIATHDPEVLDRVDRIVRLEDGALRGR